MADQPKLDDLHKRLKQLNESQIEELIHLLRVDRSHLRGSGATLNQRAIELINYLEPQVDGLRRLRASLESLLNPPDLDDPASLPDCPYQGLLAFQEKNAEFFFGREAFIDDQEQADGSIRQGLVRAVETKPLVAVVGASGSGKSSLVFAGLLPRLRKSGNWLIESLRPEKQPFSNLGAALIRQLEPALDRVSQIAKRDELADIIQKHGIASAVSEILQGHSGKRLLLIVDQFEELYTQCEGTERDRFIDVLLEGIHKAVGLKVVLTLRADFCGQAYAYRPLADALQGADLKLGSMKPEELRQAIVKPADLMQVQFEDGLTEWLLDDVGQEAGNLPLLEFALTELWKMQRQKTLIYQAYSRLGGVAGALANHADSVYARLSESDQKRAQRIFVQLVRPGDGTEDTRRVASRAEVGTDNWDLVTRLAGEEARLVVTGRNEETVEIIHEALVRAWKCLQEWMEQDRTFRTWQEELRRARRRWQQIGQDETALLDRFLLSEAEEWQSKRREDLSAEEQEFIQLSLEVRDRRIQQRQNELQELVEQKDKALQAETVAAEQARNAAKQSEKAARAARVRTLAVTIGAVAIALSGGFAWLLQQQSLQVLRDLALGVDSGSPKLLETLPTFLDEANRDRDRNRAMAYYRKIIIEADKLQDEVDKNPNQFPNGERDKATIAQIRSQAERGLNDAIIQTLIPELKSQIQAGLSKGSFGMKIKDDWALGAEQYEPGAVRTTYEIVMKSTGADINGNGFLDNGVEVNRISNAILVEIEKTWRETTNCKCGWYGSNSLYTSDCPGLDSNSLFSLIFIKTTDYLVIGQFSQNGITKSGYSRDAAKSVHCSS